MTAVVLPMPGLPSSAITLTRPGRRRAQAGHDRGGMQVAEGDPAVPRHLVQHGLNRRRCRLAEVLGGLGGVVNEGKRLRNLVTVRRDSTKPVTGLGELELVVLPGRRFLRKRPSPVAKAARQLAGTRLGRPT